jgi:hypothetical protein
MYLLETDVVVVVIVHTLRKQYDRGDVERYLYSAHQLDSHISV